MVRVVLRMPNLAHTLEMRLPVHDHHSFMLVLLMMRPTPPLPLALRRLPSASSNEFAHLHLRLDHMSEQHSQDHAELLHR